MKIQIKSETDINIINELNPMLMAFSDRIVYEILCANKRFSPDLARDPKNL